MKSEVAQDMLKPKKRNGNILTICLTTPQKTNYMYYIPPYAYMMRPTCLHAICMLHLFSSWNHLETKLMLDSNEDWTERISTPRTSNIITGWDRSMTSMISSFFNWAGMMTCNMESCFSASVHAIGSLMSLWFSISILLQGC